MDIFLGVDFGSSFTKVILLGPEDQVHFKYQEPTSHETLFSLGTQLKKIKMLAMQQLSEEGKIVGAGIGLPGLISKAERQAFFLPNFGQLSTIPFDTISAVLDLHSLVFENDVNAAVYGEWTMGVARGCNNFVLVSLGTGFGVGLVLNGRLYHGACGYAGQLGHTALDWRGSLCSCGRVGCIETQVINRTTQRYPSVLLEEQSGPGIHQGDEHRYLGGVIALLINLLNPDMVVFAGKAFADSTFLDSVKKGLERACIPVILDRTRLELSTLDPYTGALGCAKLVSDDIKGKS